jgi:hypothetical protein
VFGFRVSDLGCRVGCGVLGEVCASRFVWRAPLPVILFRAHTHPGGWQGVRGIYLNIGKLIQFDLLFSLYDNTLNYYKSGRHARSLAHTHASEGETARHTYQRVVEY